MEGSGGRDRISVRGMLFLARHGVTLDERLEPQPFEVDVELHKDLSGASASDELADTIDYSALFSMVGTIVEGPRRISRSGPEASPA